MNYINRIKLLTLLKDARPKTLAERVKLLRTALGLTQAEFAKLAGIKSDKTVGHWESGRNKKMPSEAVINLCEKLGIAVKWLQGADAAPDSYINVPVDEQEMLTMYRALSDKGRESIRSIMEAMLERGDKKPSAYDPYPNAPKLNHESNGD